MHQAARLALVALCLGPPLRPGLAAQNQAFMSEPLPPAPAATTPEGYPLVSADMPHPSFATERIRDNPNTIGVWFGVKVGDRPVSYYVAFSFDKGQRQGQGLVGTIQDGRRAGSGIVAADRIDDPGTGRSYLRVIGPLQPNDMHLPGLCAFAQVAKTLDRIDLVPDDLLAVYALDASGGCDMKSRIGLGTLK